MYKQTTSGVFIFENDTPPPGNISQGHLGRKYEKGERKRGKCESIRRKTKDKKGN
jgi:hypothetical protein